METRDIIKRDEYTAQSQQTSTHRPVRMHWAWAYLLISWVFLICVVVQVFLAGLAIFMNWSYFEWHASFAHFFELLPLVLIGLAFVSRLPRSLRWLPTVAFLLIIVQYATAEMLPIGTSYGQRAFHILVCSKHGPEGAGFRSCNAR
jgi:Family of unknown function (DUF6220)